MTDDFTPMPLGTCAATRGCTGSYLHHGQCVVTVQISPAAVEALGEERPLAPGATADRSCRGCGCTDERGCLPVCWWISDDLCSACQPVPLALSDWLLGAGCLCGHLVTDHDAEGCGGRFMFCGCERPAAAALEIAVMTWLQARFRSEIVRLGVGHAIWDADAELAIPELPDDVRDDVDVALRQLLLELFRPVT